MLARADETRYKALGGVTPTYDNMDAGTFARAIAAEDGRKGASKVQQMNRQRIADYRDPDVEQPKSVVKKVESMLNGMGGRTLDEHAALSMGGIGGRTLDEHTALCMGERTVDEHAALCLGERTLDEHAAASARGGGPPKGGFDNPAERDAHRSSISMAGVYRMAAKGKCIYRISVVCEGQEHVFFTECDPDRVHLVNAFPFWVKPLHGKLHEIVNEGEKSVDVIRMHVPESSEKEMNNLEPLGTTTAKVLFSRGRIEAMKRHQVTWTVAEYPVTADMVEAHNAEKKLKKRQNQNEYKARRKRKGKA